MGKGRIYSKRFDYWRRHSLRIHAQNHASDPNHVNVAIDAIAFPKQKDPDFLPMQRLFAQIVSDPDVQVRFAYPKGSLPVVKNINEDKLDPCAKRIYPLLERKQQLLLNPRFITGRGDKNRSTRLSS